MGTLGTPREPLDIEFTYFDATVRVHPYATDGVEIEFLEAGRNIDMSALEGVDLSHTEDLSPEQMISIAATMGKVVEAGYRSLIDALRALIHPDDFEKYWRLGQENGQLVKDRMTDIRAITRWVVAASTGFPTGRPGGSTAGPTPTGPGSSAGSSSPGTDLRKALALERGRPDIQEFYVMQAEDADRRAREEREQAAADQRKLAAAGLTS